MTHALTLTLPVKQDSASQNKLATLAAIFTDHVQPAIDAALKKSRIVHFARVVVIENKYIQAITEYEGLHDAYTEFFRRDLTPVFAAIFELADQFQRPVRRQQARQCGPGQTYREPLAGRRQLQPDTAMPLAPGGTPTTVSLQPFIRYKGVVPLLLPSMAGLRTLAAE